MCVIHRFFFSASPLFAQFRSGRNLRQKTSLHRNGILNFCLAREAEGSGECLCLRNFWQFWKNSKSQ
jgi:hypothetical protein